MSAQLVSLEKSEKAFEYLKKNQTALELSERSQIHLTDVMQFNSEQKFDIVVANPPYIDILDASIQASVKTFEPHEALFSKSRGFEDIKNWARKSQEFLKINGALFFEIGHTQGAECLKIMSELNFYKEVIVLKDLAGLDRVIKAIL